MSELQLALDLKKTGMAATYDAGSQWWKERAHEIACTLRGEVMGEDIRHAVETEIGESHSPHFWGAFTSQLIRDGVIEPTGEYRKPRSAKSHASKKAVYRVVP